MRKRKKVPLDELIARICIVLIVLTVLARIFLWSP